jgi:hypothetical protein
LMEGAIKAAEGARHCGNELRSSIGRLLGNVMKGLEDE